MTRLIPILCFAGMALISCNQDHASVTDHNNDVKKTGDDNDTTVYQDIVMLKKLDDCTPHYYFKETRVSDLYGVWEDTMTYALDNDCWYGVRYVNRSIKLRCDSLNRYTFEISNSSIEADNFNQSGEYFLTVEDSVNYLTIAINNPTESRIEIGESIEAMKFQLFWNSDSSFLLIPPLDFFDRPQAFELILQ